MTAVCLKPPGEGSYHIGVMWGNIGCMGIMEKKMETTISYRAISGYIYIYVYRLSGVLEQKMETTFLYRVLYRVIW